MKSYNVEFYPQIVSADTIEEVVKRVQRAKDIIPFRIFEVNQDIKKEIAQWRDHSGITLLQNTEEAERQ